MVEQYQNFIDGAFAGPPARTMTTTNPYTGEVVWVELTGATRDPFVVG